MPKINELDKVTYIGDGVYVGRDSEYVWLWTSDGITNKNFIALEPPVLNALMAYMEKNND